MITKIITYMGIYAPIILFLLSLFLLRNMTIYLYTFIYGFIINNILNIVLKLAIKEPRPTDDQKALEIGVVNGARISFDKFGMPSGHAQNCAYCIGYISMVLNDPLITGIYSVITSICLYQRWLFNNHSLLQLLVGLFTGSIVSYGIYYVGNSRLKGSMKLKPDDNYIGFSNGL